MGSSNHQEVLNRTITDLNDRGFSHLAACDLRGDTQAPSGVIEYGRAQHSHLDPTPNQLVKLFTYAYRGTARGVEQAHRIRP